MTHLHTRSWPNVRVRLLWPSMALAFVHDAVSVRTVCYCRCHHVPTISIRKWGLWVRFLTFQLSDALNSSIPVFDLMASKKRGRKAETFVFSTEQDTILTSYLLRFEEEITKLGILHEKYSPKLAAVKRVFTTKILELPEFHSLKLSDVPLSQWTSVCHFSSFSYLCLIFPGFQTIKTKFGNHLNNVMRKKDASRPRPSHSSSPIASRAPSQQKVAEVLATRWTRNRYVRGNAF